MALQDLPVRVALRGVDKKTDQRLVIPSKLTEAYDIEFDASDIITRAGLSVRSLAGAFTTPVRMFEHSNVPNIEFNNGETLRANGSAIVSQYGGAAPAVGNSNKLMRVGAITRRLQQLVRKPAGLGIGTSFYTLNFDTAFGITTYCLVWENDRLGTVQWSVRDSTTDVEISGGVFSSGTDRFVKPRVIYDSTNARFAIFYARYAAAAAAFSVYGEYVPAAGGAIVPMGLFFTTAAGVAVENGVNTAALFDVAIYQGQGYAIVARSTVAAGNIYMKVISLGLVAVTATTNAAPATVPVSLTAHATYVGGVFTAHALYGAGLNLRGYTHTGGVQSAEATIVAYASTLVGRIVVTELAGDLIITHDGFTSTANSYAYVNVLRCTTAHVWVSQVNATRIIGFLAGRAFTMRGREFIPVLFTSVRFQSVVLVFDLTAALAGLTTLGFPLSIVARLDWGEAAVPSPLALDSAHRLPGCSESLMPYLKYESNTRLAGTEDVTAVAVAAAKFASTEQLGDAKWNGLTYLAGALPMVTDGQQMVEEGFHWAPEVIGTFTLGFVTIPPVATGTGIYDFPAVGTFVVVFTECWQDAQGNWHESGHSSYCTVTTTLGNLAINPTILRPPTLKANSRLTMYRTLGSSTNTTLYLAHTDELGVGGYVTDANLASGEVLYTEGGILGNTPAPSCRHLAVFNERMVASGCGDGSRVYWTKQNSPGFAAEFVSDDVAFQQTVKSEIGRVVATAEMVGKLVVGGEKGFGIMYGTGPNSSGEGRYTTIETVATGMGVLWTAPKSVRLATEGIWFQSIFGLRLFTNSGVARGEGGMFVGSELDPIVTTPVVTLAGATEQQTRFFSSAYCFMWDQTWGQFAIFTGHASVDACLINGNYYFVQSNGGVPRLQYRNPLVTVDEGEASSVRGLIQTAPIQVAGIQGFQRVRRMMLLGKADVGGAPLVNLEVAYDGEQVTGAPEVAGLGPTVSASGITQFQHQFFKQKCQSMLLRLTFWDDNQLSRIRLTDLALAVGVKYGTSRTPESK